MQLSFRFDELSKLRGRDVRFLGDRMELNITSSKTDQYRQGATLLIARTGLPTCPVRMLERYMAAGKVELGSDKRLFRAIGVTKRGESLRASGSLSYTRMREIVMSKLRSLGYDTKKFGLHSFRVGGATAAANAPGISERHFKRHGRWEIGISQRWICERLREQSPLGVKESGYLDSFYTAMCLLSLKQLVQVVNHVCTTVLEPIISV